MGPHRWPERRTVSGQSLPFLLILRHLALLPQQKCDLMILWVPVHSDIDENEKADELARAQSDSKFIGPAVGIFATIAITSLVLATIYVADVTGSIKPLNPFSLNVHRCVDMGVYVLDTYEVKSLKIDAI